MWGVRSFVLGRKGVLLSNPDVKAMTDTMWMFEYQSLIQKDRRQVEIWSTVLKNTLISVLGLNLIRPEGANGSPKQPEEMTDEERTSYIPLVAWCGRAEILKAAYEQMKLDVDPDKVVGDSNYEALVAAIDAAGGDMEPILTGATGVDLSKIPKDPRLEHQKTILDIKDRSEVNIDVEDV